MLSKKFLCLTLAFMLLLTPFILSSCGDQEKNETLRTSATALLDALIESDQNTVYRLLEKSGSKTQIDSFYENAKITFGNISSYTLRQVGWNAAWNNGVSTYSASFQMTAQTKSDEDARIFLVETTMDKEGDLIGFYISEDESGATKSSSSVITWQIVLTVVSLSSIAFCIVMIVDCSKRKIKHKWLWILLILLSLSLTLTVQSQNVSFRFFLGLFFNFSTLTASTNVLSVKIIVPIGAIIYLFLRKRITVLQSEQPLTEDPQNNPAPPDEKDLF